MRESGKGRVIGITLVKYWPTMATIFVDKYLDVQNSIKAGNFSPLPALMSLTYILKTCPCNHL